MLRYTIHRLLLTIPVLVGISVVVFLIMALIPGDPATAILGAFATPENATKLRAELGLDRPLIEQYFTWAGNLLSGDFGRSYALNRPVLDELLERLGPTLLLAGSAMCVCVLLGLIAGLLAAVKQYTWVDQGLTLFTLIGISAPSFWLGLMAVSLFTVQLGWLPASGMYTPYGDESLGDLLVHLLMPAVTLGLVASSVIARLTRTSMLEQLRQDYVRTARAKGERETAVVIRHAFRNALVGLIPVLGLQAGFVLGGAVYIETVFQWPGIGRMLVNAISTRDILLVQGGVMMVATIYVFFNLLADLIQHALDPRIQHSHG
ncbi:MAG: ABC transporter permease [bacterium]|jgi:peptide/nickel transport system permease protein|nr:ABC transporter permease [Pseudomonadota bacterium]HBM54635.1 glutathione ABC transporter permease GsiC [Deltaproteobacteria bacterium]|tara:strand:- start:1894 stop:2850 length:957 start_codon:yes stop_codon:yes gene_type:complete